MPAFAAIALAGCCALASGTVLLLVIARRGCIFVARPYKIKNCRTTSTEQCACIATDSDTLPITSRSKPRLPCDPIMIKSACHS